MVISDMLGHRLRKFQILPFALRFLVKLKHIKSKGFGGLSPAGGFGV